jgi:hypothetical protein
MKHKLLFKGKHAKSTYGELLFIYVYTLKTLENDTYNEYTIEATLRGLDSGNVYLSVYGVECENLCNEETLTDEAIISLVENEYFNN